MQNDPVLVEKVARAIRAYAESYRDMGDVTVNARSVAYDLERNVVQAALSVIGEYELASAPTGLGKDQSSDQASRHVVPLEWQPIETAPKDGRLILVVGGRRSEPAIVGADGEYWRMEIGTSRAIPTHWMPLPAPPSSSHKEDECTGAPSGPGSRPTDQAASGVLPPDGASIPSRKE